MIKMFFRTTILLFSFVLAGCVTPLGVNKHNYEGGSVSRGEEGKGVIIGSMVRDDDEQWDQYRIEIRSIDKSVRCTLALGTSVFWNNEKDIGKPGIVFAKSLPPGKYEIYEHSRYEGIEWMWTNGYSVKFDVREGAVHYLGRFEIHHNRYSIGLFDSTAPLLFDWTVSDNLEEDKEYIIKKYPEIDLRSIRKDLIELDSSTNTVPVSMEDLIEVEPVEEADLESAINIFKVTCSKPYRLAQDCSNWSGAKRKIVVDGIDIKISGSECGNVILLMDAHPIENSLSKPHYQRSEPTNNCYKAVRKILLENGIDIIKVIPIISFGKVEGYLLELTGDGYSILKGFTVTKFH